MSTVYIYEVDAGPAGTYWEGAGLPDDYPVTTWNDTAQLGRDIMELSGEGHEIIVRSQAWYVENECPHCGSGYPPEWRVDSSGNRFRYCADCSWWPIRVEA